MKCLLITTSVFLMASFASCNNNSADATNNKSEVAAQNNPPTSSPGDIVFSYILDGTKVLGGEVDTVLMSNTAALSKSDGKPDRISFFLNDAYKDNTETYPHSLRFSIPGKTGTATLTSGDDNWTVELFLGNDQDAKYVLYGNEDFSINVTNISANRVSGIFSGKLKIVNGTGAGKSELTITDGKFDIPLKMDAH